MDKKETVKLIIEDIYSSISDLYDYGKGVILENDECEIEIIGHYNKEEWICQDLKTKAVDYFDEDYLEKHFTYPKKPITPLVFLRWLGKFGNYAITDTGILCKIDPYSGTYEVFDRLYVFNEPEEIEKFIERHIEFFERLYAEHYKKHRGVIVLGK